LLLVPWGSTAGSTAGVLTEFFLQSTMESESKGCSCRSGGYEGPGLGPSLVFGLVLGTSVSELPWPRSPTTPEISGLVHPLQRLEVLLLLSPGLNSGSVDCNRFGWIPLLS
jgi:hypothetical protein